MLGYINADMKNLLVPTDFSENAKQAFFYAVELANALGNAQITLLHVYEVRGNAGMFMSVRDFMRKDAAKKAAALIEEVSPKLREGVSIVSRLALGRVVEAIEQLGESGDYELILMGTQGASGLQEIFFGSNTNAVIKKGVLPVLAIPEGCRFQPIRRMVFAVDEEGLNSEAEVAPLLSIAKAFGASVSVFHQAQAFEKDGIDPSIGEYLKGVEHAFHYELDEERVNESIKAFVADTGAEMLCMIRRSRGLLEEIFRNSVTSKAVFSSEVPLLVLKEEN